MPAPPRRTLAIIACVKSGRKERFLNQTALSRTLLPSLAETVTEAERALWTLRLYLCADADDAMYMREAQAVVDAPPRWLEKRLRFYPRVPNRIPSREAAAEALAEGADFLHRTNDDIRYTSPGWVTAATGALGAMRPPLVGVVGPRVSGDGSRYKGGVTVDLVHRTHLRIFAEYYPPQLDNWYVDDWIDYVYVGGDERRSAVLAGNARFPGAEWRVVHAFNARRYRETKSQWLLLPPLVECGRDAVSAFVARESARGPLVGAGGRWQPLSCRAFSPVPALAEIPPARRCANRSSAIGGLETESKLSAGRESVQGWCQLFADTHVAAWNGSSKDERHHRRPKLVKPGAMRALASAARLNPLLGAVDSKGSARA